LGCGVCIVLAEAAVGVGGALAVHGYLIFHGCGFLMSG
jgi:hypothetical protein